MTSRAASIGASATTMVGATLSGLWAAWTYFKMRPARGTRARVSSAGVVEIATLFILFASLIIASMILIDPLVPQLRFHMPAGVVMISERVTKLGLGGVVLVPLAFCLLAVLAVKPYLDDMGRRIAAATVARLGFLFISIAGAGLIVLVVKYALGRARPYVALHLAGPNPTMTFDWLSTSAGFASFPSGHSTIVFATAVAFAALFPRARVILIILAALVASTRVVLGSHYPSDVLAGGALATAFTLSIVKVFAARRLVFSVAPDGTISPMSGPTPRRLARLVPPSSPAPAFEEARS